MTIANTCISVAAPVLNLASGPTTVEAIGTLVIVGGALALAYAMAWAASTIPELYRGRVVCPAENPTGRLFWWWK